VKDPFSPLWTCSALAMAPLLCPILLRALLLRVSNASAPRRANLASLLALTPGGCS